MILPQPLNTYFEAQNIHDIEAIVACFTPHATVRDEGEDITGHDAIRAWKEKVRDKYHFTSEPLRHWREGIRDFVTARVTGKFPGSPVELTFQFTLEDHHIAALKVLA